MSDALKALMEQLGHPFRRQDDLKQALTHSSTGGANYERLEFLGDRVLNLVIADLLFDAFPKEAEGDLAKRHAALVQGEMLATLAREINLGAALDLSTGERQAGGSRNDNILADAFEAVLGALYRDGGLPACRTVIEKLCGDRLRILAQPPQDPKTMLQEWAQGRGLPLPRYELTKRAGPDHAPQFEITVTVDGMPPATGAGPSRRAAEKEAAAALLKQLPA